MCVNLCAILIRSNHLCGARIHPLLSALYADIHFSAYYLLSPPSVNTSIKPVCIKFVSLISSFLSNDTFCLLQYGKRPRHRSCCRSLYDKVHQNNCYQILFHQKTDAFTGGFFILLDYTTVKPFASIHDSTS